MRFGLSCWKRACRACSRRSTPSGASPVRHRRRGPGWQPRRPDEPRRSGAPIAPAGPLDPLAVYTDISDAELEDFLARYDLGAPATARLQGRGRRGGELQLPAGDRDRPLLPDHLRAAGAARGPAVLPRHHAAPGAAGVSQRDADRRQVGCAAGRACAASRPPLRRVFLEWARSAARSTGLIAAKPARAWPGCTPPARDLA